MAPSHLTHWSGKLPPVRLCLSAEQGATLGCSHTRVQTKFGSSAADIFCMMFHETCLKLLKWLVSLLEFSLCVPVS